MPIAILPSPFGQQQLSPGNNLFFSLACVRALGSEVETYGPRVHREANDTAENDHMISLPTVV